MRTQLLVLLFTLHQHQAGAQSPAQWSTALDQASRLSRTDSADAQKALLDAESLARESGDGIAMAQAWRSLAIWHSDQGGYEESNLLLRKALAVYERVPQQYPLELASVFHLLGANSRQMDRRQAEDFQWRAVAIIEQTQGPRHPELVPPLIALGVLYAESGRLEEARHAMQRALDIGTTLHDPDNRQLAMALVGLSEIQLQKGDYSAARASAGRALRASEKSDAPNHLDSVAALSQLGRVVYQMGRYKEAETHWRRGLNILEGVRPAGHPDVVALKAQVAQVLRIRGDFAGSERVLLRAANETETGQSALHAVVLHQLAVVIAAQKRHAEAEALFRRSLALTESVLGARNTEASICAVELSYSLVALKRYGEAEELLRNSIVTMEAIGSSTHPWFLDVLEFHSKLLRKMKRTDDARAVEARVQTLVASGIRRPGRDGVDIIELKALR